MRFPCRKDDRWRLNRKLEEYLTVEIRLNRDADYDRRHRGSTCPQDGSSQAR